MNSENTSSCIPQNGVNKITTNNYSNVLKAVHENIDDYVGTKINLNVLLPLIFTLYTNIINFLISKNINFTKLYVKNIKI